MHAVMIVVIKAVPYQSHIESELTDKYQDRQHGWLLLSQVVT
jgi:hypothetical protein